MMFILRSLGKGYKSNVGKGGRMQTVSKGDFHWIN